MAAFGKRGRKLSSHSNEIDGPIKSHQDPARPKKQSTNNDSLDILPDKQLEERILSDCSEYLTNNLPADDVAPVMLTRNLLTPKEYDEYKTMKRSGRSTMADMSEYLLECLRRRQAGFLKKFCGILREIEAAMYLGEHIQKAYHEANLHGGFNTTSRDRLSKISLSDPDLRPRTPQGNIATSCTLCKELKKRIRKMHKQNSELKDQLSDYQRQLEAKIKIEGQLEILQDQLQQEEADKQCLKRIIPHLREAAMLIEGSCRTESATGTSGAQQTLSRINDLIHEQGKHEKYQTDVKRRHFLLTPNPIEASKRDSALSTFSDISSVTESSLTDEDRYGDSASHLEKNRLSTDINKQVVSDLHRSVTQNHIKSKSSANQNEPMEATQNVTSSVENQQGNVMESTKEIREECASSESSPTNGTGEAPKIPVPIKSDVNIPTRLRHSSESSVPIKQNKAQAFLHDRKIIPRRAHQAAQCNIRAPQREHHSQEEPDELSMILSKRREKIDSENSFQQPLTYQSQ